MLYEGITIIATTFRQNVLTCFELAAHRQRAEGLLAAEDLAKKIEDKLIDQTRLLEGLMRRSSASSITRLLPPRRASAAGDSP